MSDLYHELMTNGYVVIRVYENAAEKLAEFMAALRESPEYEEIDDDTKFALGGIGYLPQASMAHHPAIRKLAYDISRCAFEQGIFGKILEENPKFKYAITPDRAVVRHAKQVVGKGLWHQDFTPKSNPGDWIGGGWIVLSDEPQYFSCVPGSHVPTHEIFQHLTTEFDGYVGFAKFGDEADQKYVSDYVKTNGIKPVTIQPGEAVLFMENIVHTVYKNKPLKSGKPLCRQHIAWYFTEDDTPLIDRPIARAVGQGAKAAGGDKETDKKPARKRVVASAVEERYTVDEMLTHQSVPVIKSMQQSPTYTPSHVMFHPEMIDAYTENMAPECREIVKTKDGPRERVRKYLPSLAALSAANPGRFKMQPAYTEEERSLLYPSRLIHIQGKIWKY
jgi:hypothetical protein